MLGGLVDVEPWIRKANREMVMQGIEFRPDLVAVIGAQPLRAGALAQLKIACPNASLAFVWPDPLVNLSDTLQGCLRVFDVVATYSSSHVPLIQALGAPHAFWLPLGADEDLHGLGNRGSAAERHYEFDVSFIGDWRPEREAALSTLANFDLKIWGTEWERRCKENPFIKRAWEGKPLRGSDYAETIRASKVNINVIDPTCYPAANMRSFEIPIAGGLQLSSPCPEMQSELRNGEHVFYYEDPNELPGLVGSLLADDARRFEVADAAHALVSAKHTYLHRAEALLRECDGRADRTGSRKLQSG